MTTLSGRRVVVTRTREAAGELVAILSALGATTNCYPPFTTVPSSHTAGIDGALTALRPGGWIAFTSAAAVRSVAPRMKALALDKHWRGVRLGAIGSATARVLADAVRQPDLVARDSTGLGLAEALGALEPAEVIYPCSNESTTGFATKLRHKGWIVHQIVTYRLEPRLELSALRSVIARGEADVVVFTSPSSARMTLRDVASVTWLRGRRPRVVAIGPTTAVALANMRVAVDAVARTPAAVDVGDAVRRALNENGSP